MKVRILFPLAGGLLGIVVANLLGYAGALSGLMIGVFAIAAYALGLWLYGSNR